MTNAVARYGQAQEAAPSAEEVERAINEMTRGKLYKVEGGKQVANAAAINKSFLDRASTGEPVGTTVLDAGKNDRQAWAKVAAFKGTKEAPVVWCEDYVCIDYELMRQKILWDAIDKGVTRWESDESGGNYRRKYKVDFDLVGNVPVPREPWIQMHLIRLWLQKKIFAERDAVTHATERSQRKILAMEWREAEEQEDEREEMEDVNEMRANERGTVNLDDTIPFGPLKGKASWRGATNTPEGRSELGRLAQSAKVQKYADAARAALAEWKERNPAQTSAPSAPPQPQEAPAQPQAPRKAGRPRKTAQQQSDEPPPPTDSGPEAELPPAPPPPPAPPAPTTDAVPAKPEAPAAPPAPPPAPPAASPAPPPAPPAPTPTPNAAPTVAASAAPSAAAPTEDRVKAERDLLFKDIRLTVSRWPFVVVDEHLAAYSAAIANMRGVQKIDLGVDADPADLKRLQSYVNGITRVYDLTKKAFPTGDQAIETLNLKATQRGYKKFFDPTLKKSDLDKIEKEILLPVDVPPGA